MKKLFMLIGGLWLVGESFAQTTINRIEYFHDTDPGYGNGTAVSFTPAATVTNLDFTVSLSNISTGFHTLFVRARSSNNRWSTVARRTYYKDAIVPSTVVNLNRVEYFIDTDPGFGNGTSVAINTAPNIVNLEYTISLNNVTTGFHTLFVRVRDANGRWSIVARRTFYKDAIPTGFAENIVYIESFIDNDPGYNNGTSIPFTPSTQIIDLITSLNLNGVSSGAHKLFVRARNAAGRWSSLAIRDFVVQPNVISITGIPNQWCRQVALSVPFTVTGTYNTGNVFTAQLSDANGSFTNPISIGTIAATTSATIQATIPNSVALGQNYQIRVVSSNPAVSNQPTLPLQVAATCPDPCPTNISLFSPNNNYSSGTQLIRARSTNGIITASNVVTGTARVTYEAPSIVLTPGFQANTGTVFMAQRGGCN